MEEKKDRGLALLGTVGPLFGGEKKGVAFTSLAGEKKELENIFPSWEKHREIVVSKGKLNLGKKKG